MAESLSKRLKKVLVNVSPEYGQQFWNKLTDFITTNCPNSSANYDVINSVEFMEALINLPHWHEICETILESITHRNQYFLIQILISCKMNQEIAEFKQENANENNNNNNNNNQKKKKKGKKDKNNNDNNNNTNKKKKKKKKKEKEKEK